MKKIIFSLVFLLFIFNITFASENNIKQKVYLNVVNQEVANNQMMMVYENGYYKNQKILLQIVEILRKVSNEKIILVYNKFISLNKNSLIYKKYKQLLDVLTLTITDELISKNNIEKEYIYSNNDWYKYQNKELGFELIYPSKYVDGNDREVIERGNMVYISPNKKTTEFFKEKMKTEDNYYLSNNFPQTYLVGENINNDEEITNFLKKTYGENCGKFEKIKSNEEAIYNLNIIQGHSISDNPEDCLNSNLRSGIYSEKLKKVIIWHNTLNIVDIDAYWGGGIIHNTIKFLEK